MNTLTERSPFPPKVKTTLYLYDKATPTLSDVSTNHATVEVDCGGSSLQIACWTPETLRRLAGVLVEAADELHDARQYAAVRGDTEAVPA